MGIRAGRAACLIAVVAVLSVSASGAGWVWTPEIGRFIRPDRMPAETPELQLERARSYMLSGDYKRALVETRRFDEFYIDSEYADDNQFLRGEIELAQGDHMDAAKSFQQVVNQFPETDLFEQVIEKQYGIGDWFYEHGQKRMAQAWWRPFKKRPFKKAIEVYNMVIDNQPFTEAAAEAQYKIGLCHFTREEYVEAAFEYRRVVEDYAQSDWVDDAAYGLAMCYYRASLPPDYDQSPSLLAIDAIDDFKERFPADPRVEELETIRAEMRELVAAQRLQTAQFYDRRRKFKAAAIYFNIVAEEFGDTTSAGEARSWLQENPGLAVEVAS